MRILTRAAAQMVSMRPPENPLAANSLPAARNIRSRVPSGDFTADLTADLTTDLATFGLGWRRSSMDGSEVSKSCLTMGLPPWPASGLPQICRRRAAFPVSGPAAIEHNGAEGSTITGRQEDFLNVPSNLAAH